jgi:hypothetical protein
MGGDFITSLFFFLLFVQLEVMMLPNFPSFQLTLLPFVIEWCCCRMDSCSDWRSYELADAVID